MAIKITCISKANGDHENPYEAISHLTWQEDNSGKIGRSTREQMYTWIEINKGIAYVKDSAGNIAKLITAISNKNVKYVKTVADDTKTDNLLSLKEC